MFGFRSNKEMLEAGLRKSARDLVSYANDARKLADETTSIDVFVSQYDKMLECMRGVVEASKEVSLAGLVMGSPLRAYCALLRDRQQDTRDAIERCYNHILKQCATTYRNDRRMARSLCDEFANDIAKNRKSFDDETYSFALDLQERLRKQVETLTYETPLTSSPGAPSPMSLVDGMSGVEFEQWCAELLERNGFHEVKRCGGAGDQGVDIVATKDEVRYAIQCKCYATDLGNTPVQEVYAGKQYYRCQVGVVMTNRHFTKGAVNLAAATGVLLWDRERLLKMCVPASV